MSSGVAARGRCDSPEVAAVNLEPSASNGGEWGGTMNTPDKIKSGLQPNCLGLPSGGNCRKRNYLVEETHFTKSFASSEQGLARRILPF